jgi:hypothetical protein
LTVSAQDAIQFLGTPNAVDICVRCHFPQGWLDGRSDPVNCADMRGEDYDGVSCKICHYLYDPFYQSTYDGIREGNDWINYWDEATDIQSAIDATYNADAEAASAITYFNGSSFFSNNAPASAGYTENGPPLRTPMPNTTCSTAATTKANICAAHAMTSPTRHWPIWEQIQTPRFLLKHSPPTAMRMWNELFPSLCFRVMEKPVA